MENEEPKKSVDNISEKLFHLAESLATHADAGREFPPGEIMAVAKRLQDYAADLQLAASRLP
jgi:hypothetical protein